MKKIIFIITNLVLACTLIHQNFTLLAKSEKKNFIPMSIKYTSIYEFENKKSDYFYLKNDNELYITSNNKIFLYKNNKIKEIKSLNTKIKYVLATQINIIIYTKNKKLIAINKKNHTIDWTLDLNEKLYTKPLISNEKIFINQQENKITAINIKDGLVLWKFLNESLILEIKNKVKSIQTNNLIYYIYPNQSIISIKKKNGNKDKLINVAKRQITNFNKVLNFISDIVIYNKILYLCYSKGNFISIDPNTRKIIFEKNTKTYKNITIYKDKLIIIKKNGFIKCFNKLTGKNIWTILQLKNKNLNKPLILRKKKSLLISDNNGNNYFINIKTGEIKQSFYIPDLTIKKSFINKKETNILTISKTNIYNIKLH